MRTQVLAPYCCYLRVYEPLASFPERERSGWEDGIRVPEVAAGGSLTGALAVAEQREALAALLPVLPPGVAAAPRRAYALDVDGVVLMCPDEATLRVRQALGDLLADLPEQVLRALVPAGGLERVDFAALREETCPSDAVPHILTARWHVPLVWFVIFGDEDRSVGMDPVPELRYRTPMVEARRRLARAHRMLGRARPDWKLDPLVRLGRWIEAFHPHAWVELDYGGLVNLMAASALAEDRSAKDVTAALDSVAQGDDEEALDVYRRLRKRWWALRVKERAS
ncbi:MAG TPA: hypothetical protein VE287_10875 [Actinopolymorphaceae bacterium]|nr:hypothetical protein [Actinopolymorphaceae bacterium]